MAVNLPDEEHLDTSASEDAILLADSMANPTTLVIGTDLFLWNPASSKWDRFTGVNGQAKVSVYDTNGNPVSDTFDQLLEEIRLLRQGMILAGYCEDMTPGNLATTTSAA